MRRMNPQPRETPAPCPGRRLCLPGLTFVSGAGVNSRTLLSELPFKHHAAHVTAASAVSLTGAALVSWCRIPCSIPGWPGYLTLEISNHSQTEVIIDAGEPIAQIVFELLDFPTEQPYAGKYYNQERGPQPA